jgi:hypothetical protein
MTDIIKGIIAVIALLISVGIITIKGIKDRTNLMHDIRDIKFYVGLLCKKAGIDCVLEQNK